jgi:hypothetical protein
MAAESDRAVVSRAGRREGFTRKSCLKAQALVVYSTVARRGKKKEKMNNHPKFPYRSHAGR